MPWRLKSDRFDGGNIRTSTRSQDWLSLVGQRPDAQTIGGPVADIAQSIDTMLRHSLASKFPKLLPQKVNFDKIGLVLLNTYPFADDIADIRSALERIIRERADYSLFDQIFFVASGELYSIFQKVSMTRI